MRIGPIITPKLGYLGQPLKKIFAAAKVPIDRETIVVSDRGMLSALLWFGLYEVLGNRKVRNFNGGFIDWTKDVGKPVERRFNID